MAQFDYSRQLSTLMSPEIMSSIGDMREHRGKQALYEATRPDVLESLVEVAKIQSTSASNKIENIATSDKRLRDLMAEKAGTVVEIVVGARSITTSGSVLYKLDERR